MMSMETNTAKEIAEEYLAAKEFFNKIGFDLVGTRDINEDQVFFVRKKKK